MKQPKKHSILLAISILLLMISFSMRVMHWPNGKEIEIGSVLAIGVLYSLRFTAKKARTILDVSKLILICSFVVLHLMVLFKLPGLNFLKFGFILIGLAWLILEIRSLILRKGVALNVVLYLGCLVLIFKVVYSPMRYQGSSIIMTLGYLLISLGLFIDAYLTEKQKLRKN